MSSVYIELWVGKVLADYIMSWLNNSIFCLSISKSWIILPHRTAKSKPQRLYISFLRHPAMIFCAGWLGQKGVATNTWKVAAQCGVEERKVEQYLQCVRRRRICIAKVVFKHIALPQMGRWLDVKLCPIRSCSKSDERADAIKFGVKNEGVIALTKYETETIFSSPSTLKTAVGQEAIGKN